MDISTNTQDNSVKDLSSCLLAKEILALQEAMLPLGNGTGGNAQTCSDFVQCVEELRSCVQSLSLEEGDLRPLAIALLSDAEKLYPGIRRRLLGRPFHEQN